MRETKFRAYDIKNKIMHYDFQWIKSGDDAKDWIIFISDKQPLENIKTNPFINPNPYFSQQFKIMQDTGLKDVSGKEIYEGDIIKGTKDNEYQGQSAVFLDKGFIQPFSYLDCYDMDKFKVIGNIFENKELLNT